MASTTIVGKLYENWEKQGLKTSQHVIKIHEIANCLVINKNQACIHFVPMEGLKTWN